MKAICDGQKSKAQVVHETIEQYREVYIQVQRRLDALRTVRPINFLAYHLLR